MSEHQESLKAEFIKTGEEWSPTWKHILSLDENYFEAYLGLRKAARDKKHLSPKVQELCLLAMDAACTHLNDQGIRLHTMYAMKLGASAAEIMETLELSSVLGIHAVTAGVPTLLEVLEEEGQPLPQGDLDERQQKLKDEFTKRRGYWGPSWEPVIRLSPDFFEGYMNFSSVPFSKGHNALDAKTKELIYTAIDCSTTHLYLPGLKVHIRNAIKYGATPEEVMEVFQLAALMGVQTTMKGADELDQGIRMKERWYLTHGDDL